MTNCSPLLVSERNSHIQIVEDNLLEAVTNLTLAHHLLENTGLSKRYTALFTTVADALNATSEAIEHCDDQPDDDSPGAIVLYEWETLLEVVNPDDDEF
jgi:hypothetical protein